MNNPVQGSQAFHLDHLLFADAGRSVDVETFKHLDRVSHDDLVFLVRWIEPQRVCTQIMEEHGAEALRSILLALATACSAQRAPMGRRVYSIAAAHSLAVY